MFNAKSKTNASHTHTRGRKQERERAREREGGEGKEKKATTQDRKDPKCQEEGFQQVQQRKGTKKDKEWGGKEKLTVNNTLS